MPEADSLETGSLETDSLETGSEEVTPETGPLEDDSPAGAEDPASEESSEPSSEELFSLELSSPELFHTICAEEESSSVRWSAPAQPGNVHIITAQHSAESSRFIRSFLSPARCQRS